MRKKKVWTSQQKLQVVMAILKGDDTIEAICKRFSVAPSQAYAWKKHFLENGSVIFNEKKEVDKTKDLKNELSRLYEKIGQLTVERDFLKKNYDKLPWKDDEK